MSAQAGSGPLLGMGIRVMSEMWGRRLTPVFVIVKDLDSPVGG